MILQIKRIQLIKMIHTSRFSTLIICFVLYPSLVKTQTHNLRQVDLDVVNGLQDTAVTTRVRRLKNSPRQLQRIQTLDEGRNIKSKKSPSKGKGKGETHTPNSCSRLTYDNFEAPFNSMVVFGDSFSDVGNIHSVSDGMAPGQWSWNGRYCDGRVWVEYVAQFFGLKEVTASENGGNNYAWGGATTDNEFIDAFSSYLNESVPAVGQQITNYLNSMSLDQADSQLISPYVLHCLNSGYNDYWWYVYRNYTTLTGQNLDLHYVFTSVAGQVLQNVNRLYNEGARMFLVGNMLNMSSWAEVQFQTPEVLESYDVLVAGHNQVLSTLLTKFEQDHADATIYQLDNFNLFGCLNDRKHFLGIENIKDACHENESDDCGNVFSYKFWDLYHPTTHAHHYASTFAIQAIFDKEVGKRSQTIR